MTLLDNLISYWKMDEDVGAAALDAHGANDLADHNTVGSTTGILNGGRDFEADSNHALSHDTNASLSTGDIDFSLQAWVKLESKAANMMIVGKYGSAAAEYILYYDVTANRFKFGVYNFDASEASTAVADNFGSPPTGEWIALHAWHDAGGNLAGISVNAGTANTASTGGAAPTAGSGDFWVGALGSTIPAWHCDGVIDEVAFWKRLIISEEITSLVNGGSALPYESFGTTGSSARLVGSMLAMFQ